MKEYTVYYILKMHGSGYLKSKSVNARNQKDAVKAVKDEVRRATGRTAFSVTCKEPVRSKQGLTYNGMTYTRYNEMFNTLW